jgi:hypothetical protein
VDRSVRLRLRAFRLSASSLQRPPPDWVCNLRLSAKTRIELAVRPDGAAHWGALTRCVRGWGGFFSAINQIALIEAVGQDPEERPYLKGRSEKQTTLRPRIG